MMDDEKDFSSAAPQDSRSNSSDAYLQRAASAVEDGDQVLGIHLYMAAYERAQHENLVPSQEVLTGMEKAWELALATKQRSLAEYIFEKLEPFWAPEDVSRHADELQRLAFDKLEEYGFDRDAIEDMADMVNQDLLGAVPDILCQFDEDEDAPADEAIEAPSANKAPIPGGLLPANLRDGFFQKPAEKPASNEPSPAAMAVLPTTSALAASLPAVEETQERFDYRSLVGFDGAISLMGELGVGRSHDPAFASFVHMLNQRHGLPGIPGLGTLIFRCPAREDADYFMVATVGELRMPAIRMRLDHNAQGQAVLCVMASSDFKARLSGVTRMGFDTPTVVILEDLDLWDLPFFDGAAEDLQGFLQMQLSRGAREALALIQTALNTPEVTVLISATEPDEIDPYFWDLIGPHRTIDIELPDTEERRDIWRAARAQHPSLRGLDINQLVEFSRTLSRFEIFAIANEAVEDAYRESLGANEFRSVRTEDMLARLANFQPLESDEYRRMEDLAVESFRKDTSDFDDLLKG